MPVSSSNKVNQGQVNDTFDIGYQLKLIKYNSTVYLQKFFFPYMQSLFLANNRDRMLMVLTYCQWQFAVANDWIYNDIIGQNTPKSNLSTNMYKYLCIYTYTFIMCSPVHKWQHIYSHYILKFQVRVKCELSCHLVAETMQPWMGHNSVFSFYQPKSG